MCDELVYTLDVPATVLAAANASAAVAIEGQNLLPLAEGNPGFRSREYLTCRYGNSLWYRDGRSWCFGDIGIEKSWFRRDLALRNPRLFDLEEDPDCTRDIAAAAAERIPLAVERILADAGGQVAPYTRKGTTDAIGRPEFTSES